MGVWRTWVTGICWAVLGVSSVHAQSYQLSETPAVGECFRLEIVTSVNGSIRVQLEDGPKSMALTGTNTHSLLQRTLAVEEGQIRKAARFYQSAEAVVTFDRNKSVTSLREDRQLVVAQQVEGATVCYAPAGPLTREELNVTAEHFDTLYLTGLLPTREVELGETWPLDNSVVQALCSFDGLIAHQLTAKIEEVKDGIARLVITGTASGIEQGALVHLKVTASARYDLLLKRVVAVDWAQDDTREPGPVTPAAELKAVTTIRRSLLETTPDQLNDVALVSVPKTDEPPAELLLLSYQDGQQRFRFDYPRAWDIVSETDRHVILRLMERGDFVVQATLTTWQKADAGEHLSIEELKQLITATPGWEVEVEIEDGEVPAEDGRWIYRVAQRGTMSGVEAVQNVFAVAGPKGDQAIVSFIMKPSSVAKVGTRDVELVRSIRFAEGQ